MKASDKGQQAEDATNEQPDSHWADPKSLKVKEDFRSLIPLQSKGELAALEQSIKEEGCRDPLHVWKGKNVVLDGHTRRELCLKHKKQVKVRAIELPDEKAAIEYILTIQRQRRNLTREAMSYFRGAEYNAVKQEKGGNKRGRRPKDQSDPLVTTAQQLAAKYGVGEMTIKRDSVFAQAVDQIIEEHGDPEIKRKLLGADVRLTHGTAKVLRRMATKDRKKAIEQLLEHGELARKEKEKAVERKPKEIAQRMVERLKSKGDGHARSVLQQMAKMLGMEVVEKEGEK